MNFARKALAAAAIAGLGMAGFATTAEAAPKPPAKVRAGEWVVAPNGSTITPRSIVPQAGAQYKIAGKVSLFGNQNTANSFTMSFNSAPGGGAVKCVGTGSHGAVASDGKITWTNVPGAAVPTTPVNVDYTITCTYQRASEVVITERYYLNAAADHVVVSSGPNSQPVLGARAEAGVYTVGGKLPTTPGPSATPTTKPTAKPTATKTPVKDKDSNGGLAKTGF